MSKNYYYRILTRIVFITIGFIITELGFSQETPGLTFGGGGNDEGISFCIDNNGDYILAANTRSYGEGCTDLYIICLNKYFQQKWTKTIGYEHQDFARSIISVDEGYVITGKSYTTSYGGSGIYLVKTNKLGDVIFTKSFGLNPLDKCFDIMETSKKNLLLIAYTRTLDKYGGVYLIMTDRYGDKIWSRGFGFDFDEYSFDVTEDEDGNFLIIGSKDGFFNDVHANFKTHDSDIWLLKIDEEGNELTSKTYGGEGHDFGYSIESADDGGYYLLGSTQSYGEGSFDILLTKVDENGEEEWHTTYGGYNFDYGISLDRNIEGDLYLLGSTKSFGQDGSTDMYLIKTDNLGNEIWSTTIGGSDSDFGHKVIATEDSGCAIIGSTNSFGMGKSDILFTKVGTNGNIEVFANSGELISNNNMVVPNPLQENGKVIFDDNDKGDYTLELINISGVSVKLFYLNSLQPNFSAGLLPQGMYIYKLTNTTTNTKLTGKLIIN